MVAGPDDRYPAAAWRSYCCRWLQRNSAIHLYLILTPVMTNNNINKYKVILVITVGMGLLSLLFSSKILLYIGLGAGVLSLVSEKLAGGVVWVWGKIAMVLVFINTRILLSLVYFVFLLPISALSKMFSKNGVIKKRKEGSYFEQRDHLYTPEDISNTW